MPKKTGLPVERHHVTLFEGDWQRLQFYYGDSIGPSEAIRLVVRTLLNKLDAQKNAISKEVEIDMETINVQSTSRGEPAVS